MVMGERVIMNREILFKAKRKDNGEWVEGQYVYITNPLTEDGKPIKHLVCNGTNIFNDLIDPDTLCQYTGLTDKNGKKIWENDIVHCGTKLRVSWHHFKASWVLSKKGWLYNHFFGEAVEPEDVEVVGNVFDNPELLEVE